MIEIIAGLLAGIAAVASYWLGFLRAEVIGMEEQIRLIGNLIEAHKQTRSEMMKRIVYLQNRTLVLDVLERLRQKEEVTDWASWVIIGALKGEERA